MKSDYSDFRIVIPHTHGIEARTTCPQCSHTRKKKTGKCLAVNLEKETWYCHHCEWRGGLFENSEHTTSVRTDSSVKTKPTPPHTQTLALQFWNRVNREDKTVSAHPYCMIKKLDHAFGAGRATVKTKMLGSRDCIIIPVRELPSVNIVAVQLIAEDGAKQSLGPIKGHCLPLGNTLNPKLRRFVVEGWATGAAMLEHYRGNCAVFVAFGKSNLEAVAELVLKHFPGGPVTIAGEA